MPLKPCRECGREVSTDAATCPNCGTPDPTGAVAARQKAETAKAKKVGLVGCGGTLLIVLSFCAYVANDISSGDDSAPRSSVAAANSTEATMERFNTLKQLLEADGGARVRGEPPRTMRIHLEFYDVTDTRARQLAQMAYDRLGTDATVYVYDAAGLERARADRFGTKVP